MDSCTGRRDRPAVSPAALIFGPLKSMRTARGLGYHVS
jgi:hypothetical protein